MLGFGYQQEVSGVGSRGKDGFVVQGLVAMETEVGWRTLGIVASDPTELCDSARATIVAEARWRKASEFAMKMEAYSL